MASMFQQRGLMNLIYGIVIIGTILTFVIEFRPSANGKTGSLTESCAARVRGRCIDPKDFASAYRMLMPSRSAQLSRRMNLKKVALDGLIERELLDDEAKRLGIGVTDDEVTDQLYDGFVRVSVPAADPQVAQSIMYEMFQSYVRAGMLTQDVAQAHFNDFDTAIPVDFTDPKTKAFDMKIYERKVRNLTNRSTGEFRDEQQRELLAAKMRDVIREPVRVSDAEAWAEYDRRYSTATVTYVPVKESWAARWAVDVKPSDVDAWAKDHQADIDKAFEQRKKDDDPKAGHIRHILVKLPYGASDDEKAAAVARLSWAAARIKAGEPFAEVARDVSDDTGSAAHGGDVGDKTGGFVAPFKAAADALKPGETTAGAVETQFGYHLITKDDPAKTADVEAQLKREVARELYSKAKAADAAKTIARNIDDAMRRGKDAEAAIQDAIAPYVHPTKLDMLKVLPKPAAAATAKGADAGAAADGADAASAAKPAKPGATDKQAASTLPAKSFDAGTDPDRPQTKTSNAFNKGGDPFEGLSPDATTAIVSFAFSGKDGDVMPDPVQLADGLAVVQLKQHKIATKDEFEKDHDTFVTELLRAKRDEALSLYVQRLRDQAKDEIKVDESYIQEAKADGGSDEDDEDQY